MERPTHVVRHSRSTGAGLGDLGDGMSDRELLELAAKAAGIEFWFPRMNGGKNEDGTRIILTPCHTKMDGEVVEWNPLTDDGDALRLAVKLDMRVSPCCARIPSGGLFTEDDEGDDFAATRRAIVRAAAEIGKELK